MERKYSRGEQRRPRIDGPDDAAALAKVLVCDEHVVGQLLIALDAQGELCGAAFACPCDVCRDLVRSDARGLVTVANRLDAREIVLATYVDPERVTPTAADVARFEGLRVECRALGVELLDQLLMSGHQWRSVRECSTVEPSDADDQDLSEPGEDPGASTTW